jgi:hypothetical protein
LLFQLEMSVVAEALIVGNANPTNQENRRELFLAQVRRRRTHALVHSMPVR